MGDVVTRQDARRIARKFNDGTEHGLAAFARTGEIVTEGELDVITDVENLIRAYEEEEQHGLCAELRTLLEYLETHQDD